MKRVAIAAILMFAPICLANTLVHPDLGGRVLDQNKKPIPGATALVYTAGVKTGTSPFCPSCYADCGKKAVTDAQGRFTFTNIAPPAQWHVYGIMSSFKDVGTLPITHVQVDTDGTTSDVGDVTVTKAFTLSGRVVLSAGAAVPPNTRMVICPENTSDGQIIVLGRDGRFTAKGIPPGVVRVSVRIKGYRLSPRIVSLDPMNRCVEGVVDQDISDLTILLEPGKESLPTPDQYRAATDAMLRNRARGIQGAPKIMQ